MIYSRWQPDTGQYEYWESPERFGMGDDLPTPRLPAGTEIGVASVDAGRTIPSNARYVGKGSEARGMIAPVSRAGLSGIGLSLGFNEFAILALGAIAGWWLRGRKRS